MSSAKRTLIGVIVVLILQCMRFLNAASSASTNFSTTITSFNNSIISSTSVSVSTQSSTSVSVSTQSSTNVSDSTVSGTSVSDSTVSGTSVSDSNVSGISVSNSTVSATSVSAATVSGISVSDSTEIGKVSNIATNQAVMTDTTTDIATEVHNSNSNDSSSTPTTIKSMTSQSRDQETSKKPTYAIPTLINKNISISLRVRFLNANFTPELDNTTTEAYKTNYTFYNKTLYDVYVKVTGFQGIKITKFSQGSLIVHYNTTFGFDSQRNDELYLLDELKNATDKLRSVPDVDNDNLDVVSPDNLGKIICASMQCPSKSTCQLKEKLSHLLCVPTCDLKCQNEGECILNSDFEPVCRCPTKDGFIYGGNVCEQKAEKLEMSKENIIAISAGVGGGVILILLIIIMVVCCTKGSKVVRTMENVKDDASEESFKSTKDSEDGLHQGYNGKVTQTISEPSFRRSDSKVSQQLGKEHYIVSSASMQPNTRNPRDIVDSYADYRYQGQRNPVENMEMRRQSRVRVADDIEINPDYGRFSSKARDSIDIGSPYRKNSAFNYLAQRRRSSAPVDLRGNRVTQNPLFTVPANRRKSSVYMEIDDNDSKSVMYQPAKNLDQPARRGSGINTIDHPLRQGQQQAKVYDYYNRKDSVASAIYSRPRATSNADLYDFDEENNAIRSVYGVRRVQQGRTSPRRF